MDALKFQKQNPSWIYPEITMHTAMQRSWESLPSDISEQEAAGKIIKRYKKN